MKKNAALLQLLDLLEARYALRLLWVLGDGLPQTFRQLQDSLGGATPNTLNTRLKQLRATHLLEHNRQGYRLTAQGLELARLLRALQRFAPKWRQRQTSLVAASTPLPPELEAQDTQSPPDRASP
jgi:DNA-binding HxlR family transcriptional regulator